MQDVVTFLTKKKENSLEQMNLILIEEKKFVLVFRDGKSKSHLDFHNLDYELYWKHKATVYVSEQLLKITAGRDYHDLYALLTNYQKTINNRTKSPFQSNSAVVNHERLIENAIKQELVDDLRSLVSGMK